MASNALADVLGAIDGALGLGGPRVPRPEEFVDEGDETVEFLPAPDLAALAGALIERHERVAHLAGMEVVYLWRAKGGSSNGSDTLGKCQRPSGLLRHFSQADYVIWLAADHCRARLLSARQIEALLYHELCHTGLSDEGSPVIVGHDWAGFAAEIEAYGLYLGDIRRIARVVQLQFPTGGAA